MGPYVFYVFNSMPFSHRLDHTCRALQLSTSWKTTVHKGSLHHRHFVPFSVQIQDIVTTPKSVSHFDPPPSRMEKAQ